MDHYLNRARIELDAYEAAVTDWEKFRGFERLCEPPGHRDLRRHRERAWAAWEVVVQPLAARLLAGGPAAGGLALLLPPDDVVAE